MNKVDTASYATMKKGNKIKNEENATNDGLRHKVGKISERD